MKKIKFITERRKKKAFCIRARCFQPTSVQEDEDKKSAGTVHAPLHKHSVYTGGNLAEISEPRRTIA